MTAPCTSRTGDSGDDLLNIHYIFSNTLWCYLTHGAVLIRSKCWQSVLNDVREFISLLSLSLFLCFSLSPFSLSFSASICFSVSVFVSLDSCLSVSISLCLYVYLFPVYRSLSARPPARTKWRRPVFIPVSSPSNRLVAQNLTSHQGQAVLECWVGNVTNEVIVH